MFRTVITRSTFAAGLALAAALSMASPANAQTHTWNGPFTGTTTWSAGTWSTTPPAGGASGTTLIFNQLGAGTFTANNDLGPVFQLSTLTFTSGGGGFVIGNAAGNTLEIVGTGAINQNGLGVQSLSAATTLTATNTTISGTGPGNLQISGVLSGPGGLTINNPQPQTYTGLVDLTGANTFGGGVTLQAGNLRVGNATALGTGTLTINGGTLGASTATTTANAVTLNADLVYSGFSALTLTGVISESGGSRSLILSSMSASILTLQGANTYTGATLVEINPRISTNGAGAGSLTFSGANGSALNSSSFTINGGGTLTLDSSAAGANNSNRIADGAAVTISGGGLTLSGGQAASTLEDIGALSGQGIVVVTVNAGAAGNTGTTLQANSLARVDRGQFLFRGNNASFGSAPGLNVANLIFDTAPTLVGGGGGAGTTSISIIPFAIGGITTTSTGTDLVTYGANGVRPLSLAANEYATTISSGTATSDNVRLAAASAVTAPTTINALVIANAAPFTGSTSTLTVTSGTVLVTTTSDIPAGMTLDFGGAEGNIFAPATLTVNGILTGSNGLTKSGNGFLVLNNSANNVTGTLTINRGFVDIVDPAALAGFSDIRVNGAASPTSAGLGFAATSGTATVNKPITISSGYFLLGTDGGTLVLSGTITGAGGVIINGGEVELTNTTNSYTGQTRIFGGNLLIGSDSALGNGGGVDIGAFADEGIRLTGDWTTSRTINFSFASQVDTNGFNWTINSPVTGNAATVNKVGAGMWTLTQGGTLGQSLASGSGGSLTTININAGELRVTNSTGSATGTATVNIGSATLAATLSGTGRIAGNTTIGALATVSPGTGANAGTLNFGNNVTVNGTFRVDTATDNLAIGGALTLGAGSILDLTGATFDANTTYTLANYSTLTGTFGTVSGLPATHNLSYGVIAITVSPVPEPATVLLIASVALGAGAAVRRRLRVGGSPVH